MKLMREVYKKEGGQALVLALVLMLFGSLIITPLLGYMGTGLKAGRVYEGKMDKLYAADAGAEDAVNKIVNKYPALPGYPDDPPYSYTFPTLPQKVNGLQVNVTITKVSLLQGLLGNDEIGNEYDTGKNKDWFTITFDTPQATPHPDEGYIEYSCHVRLEYTGKGNCRVGSVGAFLCPFPGDASLINGPYDWYGTGVMTSMGNNLEAGSPEKKVVTGGFAFIWRWLSGQGPQFHAGGQDPQTIGDFYFKFRIYSLDWGYALYFAWGTFEPRENVNDATTEPGGSKWLIEATAGETLIRSVVVKGISVAILTWEINPQN